MAISSRLLKPEPGRPILTHLNVDTSWLISFPRPSPAKPHDVARSYFHVVIDPWLDGEYVVSTR
jgi:hypothetical protein